VGRDIKGLPVPARFMLRRIGGHGFNVDSQGSKESMHPNVDPTI